MFLIKESKIRRSFVAIVVSSLLATILLALTTASQASTPQATLTTCVNLTTHIQIALKATQKSCSSLQAPAIWHMVPSNTALPSGPGFASIRICTSKRPQFTYQYIRTTCPTYTVSTDYYRAVTPPATPSILSSSAVGYDRAVLNLASPAASDSPIVYYLVENLTTGVETQVSPNGLARLYISGLSPTTSYRFTVTAISVDGRATNSSTSQAVTTAALPVAAVQSSDATLSSLIVTTATLSPTFSSSTTSYASTVANGTISATLTPTVNESHATVTVNGTPVASGSASGGISLSIGANTITTVVTAHNGSTKTYSVVITRSGATDTTISAFSFAGLSPVVTGVVDNTAHTVALTVPYGTSPSALISTFTIGSGATAKISTTAQVSGTTANDFTSPVTYTITAQDGVTTQDYVVTVAVAAAAIGDTGPGGGIIFYSSEVAFTETDSPCNTSCHYLEWAPNTWSGGDADPTHAWSSDTTHLSGTSGTAIGDGFANTTKMLTTSGGYSADTSGAAFSVHAYTGGGKTDWFLPSGEELSTMYGYFHSSGTGGFVANYYWSSSEAAWNTAWAQGFWDGLQASGYKGNAGYVRPIRAF